MKKLNWHKICLSDNCRYLTMISISEAKHKCVRSLQQGRSDPVMFFEKHGDPGFLYQPMKCFYVWFLSPIELNRYYILNLWSVQLRKTRWPKNRRKWNQLHLLKRAWSRKRIRDAYWKADACFINFEKSECSQWEQVTCSCFITTGALLLEKVRSLCCIDPRTRAAWPRCAFLELLFIVVW